MPICQTGGPPVDVPDTPLTKDSTYQIFMESMFDKLNYNGAKHSPLGPRRAPNCQTGGPPVDVPETPLTKVFTHQIFMKSRFDKFDHDDF